MGLRWSGKRSRPLLPALSPDSRVARTEAILLVLRASLLVTGAGALLVAPSSPRGGVTPSDVTLPVLAQLALGLAMFLAVYPVATLPAAAAARVSRRAVGVDVVVYGAYLAAFHRHPGAGTFYGIFVLLVGPARWGWRGLVATAVPVCAVAIVWPQANADGSVMPAWETAFLVLLFTGPALAIGAMVRRGSGRLRQAQEQFRSAFEHASLGMALLDDAGRVLQANRALAALFGSSEAELVGRPFEERVVVEDRAAVHAALATLGPGHRGLRLEVPLERSDGGRRWGLVAASWLAGSPGVPSQVVLQVENVTERRWAQAQLSHQATHDALTGLPNRALLRTRLEQAIGRAEPVALVFLDLDRFKVVNDGLGHAVGDQLLVDVGARLAATIRPGDLVTRLGGDEFVVLCHEAEDDVTALATRLLRALDAPFAVAGGSEVVRASMGVALAGPGATPDSLIRDADTAMYRAKRAGGARLAVFTPELRAAAVRTHELEVELRLAIGNGGIDVAYQPVVDLTTGRITGVEALARWSAPGRGLVPPAEFVPLAEQSDLVGDLGDAVLRRALGDLAGWPTAEGDLGLQLAVNVSVRQLGDPVFPVLVRFLLAERGIEPSRLCLEVTETALAGDVETLVGSLRALRDLGVMLAIDDFGTGHASLTYLAQFPVDVVKVDKSFVDGVGRDAGSAAIVGGVVAMAHTFGMRVVAEGAETVLQLDVLRRLGCDLAQGYVLARPTTAAGIAELVRRRQPLAVPGPRVSAEGSAAGAAFSPARRHRLLLDAARELTACTDVDRVMEVCFRSLRSVVAFTGGSIQLVEGGMVRLAAADPAPTPEALGSAIPLGQGVSGTIALTGEPAYLPDITVAPSVQPGRRAQSASGGVRSYYGVPLVAHGRPIGVLQIDSTELDAFSDADQLLVLAFAPAVAAAVATAGVSLPA